MHVIHTGVPGIEANLLQRNLDTILIYIWMQDYKSEQCFKCLLLFQPI